MYQILLNYVRYNEKIPEMVKTYQTFSNNLFIRETFFEKLFGPHQSWNIQFCYMLTNTEQRICKLAIQNIYKKYQTYT